MSLGNGYTGPPQHDRPARPGTNVGHIDRLDVPVGTVRGKSALVARTGDRYTHTYFERLLLKSHVDRSGRGLSAGSGGGRGL